MIEQNLAFYIFIVVVLMFFLVASISIPFYGFFRKRWKGLLIGCVVQPIVCCLACVMVVYGILFYQSYDQRRHRKAAMVTLRKPGDNGHAHIWYLKPMMSVSTNIRMSKTLSLSTQILIMSISSMSYLLIRSVSVWMM